jgi:hypothetical protein
VKPASVVTRSLVLAKDRDRSGKPFQWACKCGEPAPFVYRWTQRWASGATVRRFRDVCPGCAGVLAELHGLEVPAVPS